MKYILLAFLVLTIPPVFAQEPIIGDYLEIIDIATNQFHVRGVQRVAAGANPATPFSATVS